MYLYFVECIVLFEDVLALFERKQIFLEVGYIFITFAIAYGDEKYRKQEKQHSAGVVQRAFDVIVAMLARWHGENAAVSHIFHYRVLIKVVAEAFFVDWGVIMVNCCRIGGCL